MNSKQKQVLIVVVLVVVGMLLFPPFQLDHYRGEAVELNMGYGFLFAPPHVGRFVASIDIPVLFTQWFAAVLVGGMAWFLFKGEESQKQLGQKTKDPEDKSFFETTLFIFLRLTRCVVGFVFGWQVVGLFPVLTWLYRPSDVSGDMVGMVAVKLVLMAAFGLLFFGLRRLIHWLHRRWYGVPHPALAKALAL